MSQWYRVFGRSADGPDAHALIKHLDECRVKIHGKFRGDEAGWYEADLIYSADEDFLKVERFLAEQDDIRRDLNTWAAWIESTNYDPKLDWLLEHMIATKQLFTIEPPEKHAGKRYVTDLCLLIAQFFADQSRGIYQVDGQGMFAADGSLLLAEGKT